METILLYIINTFTVTKLKAFITIVVSFFWMLIWWITIMIKAMFALLILDFILWFIYAWITHNISKKKMQLWIVKLLTYSCTLIVLNFTNLAIMWININWFWIMEFWVSYLAVNEALSCLKHLWNLWVPIPVWIVNKLENYKDNLTIKDIK